MKALRPTFAALAERLAAEGHAPDPALAPPAPVDDDGEKLPWFARVLVGVGAWLSACFVMGMCGAAFEFGNAVAVPGFVFAGIGAAILRTQSAPTGGALFVRQGAIAGLLAGQGLVIFGVSRGASDVATGVVALAVACAAILVVRDPVVRFLSALGACGALQWLVVELRLPRALDVGALAFAGTAGALWLSRPARFARTGQDALEAVAYAATLALFATLLLATGVGPLGDVASWGGVTPPGRLAAVALGLGALALALVVRKDLALGRVPPLQAVALAGLALLGPATPGSPGLAGAVGVLLLALHRRDPVLMGMAIVFLIAFLGAFYYALAATLLVKALLLALVGTALLGGALVAARRRAP